MTYQYCRAWRSNLGSRPGTFRQGYIAAAAGQSYSVTINANIPVKFSTSAAFKMKAIVNRNSAAAVEEKPTPTLKPDYILVKVKAVALNPTDWKHIVGARAPDGTTVGCDYAGIVEEVGPKVTKAFKKGDRIFGVAHGSNYSDADAGVFAEYAVVKGDVQMHVPENLSLEEACTLPLGATTVAQGLYQQALKMNLPTEPIKDKQPVLIYGGSSATGVLAIQYAKL